MLIFSTTRTLRSNLVTLAHVAKPVAVEATHRVGNKQGHHHRMQRMANTLGLKVTEESKTNYIKKSHVVDKYRRMAG